MNTLRRLAVLSVVTGLLVATASSASAITASTVRAGESSQTFIDLFTTATPAFSATPPSGLTVSFSSPTQPDPGGDPTHWKTTMTIAADPSITPAAYSFPLMVSNGAGEVIFTDTVSVEVLDPPPATTTTTTTTTVITVPTTVTTTTAAPTTTTTTVPTTTTTVPPTTTTVPPTTTPPTTVPPTTVPPTTSPPETTTATTEASPTTEAPATTVAPAATDTTLGLPGAALPDEGPPLGIIIPLGGGLLIVLGWFAIAGARRRNTLSGG